MKAEISTTANSQRFFLLALGISWFSWAWVILLKWDVWRFPAILFGALGLFGPALAEIILIFRVRETERRRDYWERLFDFKRIGWKWHLVIWLTFPVLNGLALLGGMLAGAPLPAFDTARELLSQPWRIFPFAVFILLFGPLPEELGWRGYALDGLQARYNALVSSLILGAVWSLWHLPLFFMRGTFQHDVLKFGTLDFWSFLAGTIVVSILFTWLYNNTHRSTLSAILFHFMVNFTGELMPPDGLARVFSLLLTGILSLLVVVIYGPETLAGRKARGREEKSVLRRFAGKGVCPYQLSFTLDLPLRRLILSPERLAERLHLEEDARVLEVGPGPGYFSVEMAKRVPRGRLELFDVQKEMLQKARRKIDAAGLHNVGFSQGDATALPFDGEGFDAAFLVAVLGEVSNPSACLRELYRILRSQGLLSITEQPGDPDALSRSTIRTLAERQGFVFSETYGKWRNFTMNFRKPLVVAQEGKTTP